MYRITKHPILPIPQEDCASFLFEGKTIHGQKGFTVAAALHQVGLVVHKHSLDHRERTLECGIGKCGACEMLIDGAVRRICITKVDDVKEVRRISENFLPDPIPYKENLAQPVYRTSVAIVGAGPAGLAVREELNKAAIANIVLDNNDKIGGQFPMQTHQFFFFEKEKRFGGMRGFEIAKTLAGDDHSGIFLNASVWDILEGRRLAIKDIEKQDVYFVDADYLVVATGAVPFMPAFKNDDVPGVYTAAVVQRMMNNELTLLGKNILTVGAGNIGYLTSYQAMQAGATVKAIIEAMPWEGGFPVQANRVRRLGIPIMTSHILLEAIPNEDRSGITGAIIAECKDFKAIPGTEKQIDGIDAINICTGLIPDDQLLTKGAELFGRRCYGVGDAMRIGEGTSAVLRGKQCAFEIMQEMGVRYNYDDYLTVSKEYIDSQQHPVPILMQPDIPTKERMEKRGFVQIDCLYGFACNPCAFACKHGAITKSSTSTVPEIDHEKCTGCMDCVYQCPGLAIFGYHIAKQWLFLPIEYEAQEGAQVFLVDNQGKKVGEGVIEKILLKSNKTNIARVKVNGMTGEEMLQARGFIVKEHYPAPPALALAPADSSSKTDLCRCEDITIEQIVQAIGARSFISVDELKHIARIGMGSCRGNRCIPRVKQMLRTYGIQVTGDATPRGPLSNLLEMGKFYPTNATAPIITDFKQPQRTPVKVDALIAGGGIAGSALFRYMAEAQYKPALVNVDRGGSWRNIAAGRPAFSLPALADMAAHNLEIFKELQKISNIDMHLIRYVNFAHDEATWQSLEASRAWSDAYMVEAKDFRKEISGYFNPHCKTYTHALITHNCWQATPGKTIDLTRQLGIQKGGVVLEDCRLIDVSKQGDTFIVLVHTHENQYIEYHTNIFVNALGAEGAAFARKLGIETGIYPVLHQAFITRRLPMLGIDGRNLDMLIDRRKNKAFSAVYGQQFVETGQIIGCASPVTDPQEAGKNQKINTEEFIRIISETFIDWLPNLSGVGLQAVWGGYYVEPRYIVDPALGLFIGMRGHGFMMSQYIAKLYVDVLKGKAVPDYFKEMSLSGKGLSELAFK
jgi:glycine/D-amino acid oxidase-like deaminating enzyme/Fe-S-cluster-containing hydrogenase component 2/thioredoxin reductase